MSNAHPSYRPYLTGGVPFGRRRFLAGLGMLTGASVVMSACGGDDPAGSAGADTAAGGDGALEENRGEVNIITWETYHEAPWIEAYQEASGVTINVTRAGSVDEMFAKVKSGSPRVDLAYFDIGSIPRYRDAGLIIPFDDTKVVNRSSISDGLPWSEALTIDGSLWGLPYNWGTQPLMWNADVITTAPTSWDVMWDPAYSGKVTMPDDSYIGLPMIALAAGVADPYNMSDADFETCKKKLSDLRPQLKTLTTGFDDAQNLYASGEAVVGYCQNVAVPIALTDEGMNFSYGYPAEGTPFWIDNSVMIKGGNRQEVFDFVNATLAPEWQTRLIRDTGNAGVLSYDAASTDVDSEVLARTEVANQLDPDFWSAMSPLSPQNDFDRRLELWNEFKAGL